MLASLDNFSEKGLNKFLTELKEARKKPVYYAEFVKQVQSLTEAQYQEFVDVIHKELEQRFTVLDADSFIESLLSNAK